MARPIHVDLGENERLEARIGQHTLVMDQPDADDLGPTPSEVFVASLAACTAHYLRLACRKHGVDWTGATVSATAVPAEDRPARIARIELTCCLPDDVPEKLRDRIRRTAEACYVHRSIACTDGGGLQVDLTMETCPPVTTG